MLNKLLFIFIFIFSATAYTQQSVIKFTAKEQAWIDAHPVVYHGYDPEWRPIDFVDENGNFSGVTYGYLKLIGSRIGIEFQPYPNIKRWSESIELIKQKKIMCLPAIAQNAERDKYADFTKTYSAYEYVIVTRKDADFVGGVKDLEGKKIAVAKSYFTTELLEKEQMPMDFVYRDGTEGCLLAVATGKADATVATIAIVSHYLNYNGFENLKIAAPTHFPKIEIKMAVAKGNEEFVNILQKGLNTVTEKEKSKIYKTWVSAVHFEYGVDMTKVWSIAGVSGGVALLIFGTFFYYNRKMKKEITLRKEAQHALNKSFDEIIEQKKIIELTNEEVTASITYAKRLQLAILPTRSQIKTALKNSFILFLPKDIVSGDFYYIDIKDNGNKVFFTAADCTGHGVPGAMVSLICTNALHKAIIEDDLNKPSEILDSAKNNLEQRFKRSGENIKDGMDISLCCLDLKLKKLTYSGAFNPLWIVRSNTKRKETLKYLDYFEDSKKPQLLESESFHLIEIRADRQPVGKYEYSKPFTNHEIDLIENDIIYLSTDGYSDQFGGAKGKKMKSKNFKKLLLDIQNKSMETQHDILQEKFETWKDDFEQIDDVCVFGVKV